MRESETPRIYVACLAAYNAGTLHGCWIDAAQDMDAIWGELRAMLAASPEADAEEWAIHGYEGFGDLHLCEYEGITRVHEIACFIEEHGEIGTAVLAHVSGDLEEAEQAMENYMGYFAEAADYAAQLIEDSVEVPDYLANYIDYEAMARDMEMNGEFFAIETGYREVHIFLNG